MGLIEKKEQTLYNIVQSNKAYRGDYLTTTRKKINKLNISGDDKILLMLEFEQYEKYLLHLLASTPRVRVQLDKEINFTPEEYNKVFEDL